MCPTSAMAQSNNTEEIWQDALCILHGFHWPFRIEVSSKVPDPIGKNIQARTIRLSSEALRLLKRKYKIPPYRLNVPDTLIVPEQCIIRPVEAQPCQPSIAEQQIKFGQSYTSIALNSIHIGDFLAWAMEPTSYSTCGVTELIPCALNWAGISTAEPSDCYAFVCPQRIVISGFKNGKTEDDSYMYRVPLSRIYRWDDVNQARRRVSQQLDHIHLDSVEIELEYGETHYGFSYKVSESQKSSSTEKLSETAEVEKELAELSAWVASDAKNKGYDLKGVKPLTREKLTEDTLFDQDMSNSGLVRVNKTGDNSKSVVDVSQNSEWWASDPKHEDGNSKDNHHVDNGTKEHSSNGNNEPHKIVVFGNCFMKDTKCTKITVDGIEKGDTVIARLKDRVDIIGKVCLTCDLPSINSTQVFVGVLFEESIKAEPFEIRHLWGGDETECFKKCEGTVRVFIPAEHLSVDAYSTQACLRVLKGSNSGRKSLSTSDIQVDFCYEASRSGSVPNSNKGVDHENLKNMGIEGHANSCYIDAVIFALYAFTENFDEGLLYSSSQNDNSPEDILTKIIAARNVLKYDIVTPLRQAIKVNWSSVYKFRMALSEILNDKAYLGNFMDAEAFITSLFSQVLQVPEFFVLGEDTRDYILQLFPPMSTDENGDEAESDRACVQHLIQEYFRLVDVKLQEVPRSGFIIKLPVSNGVPHFKLVYPNLKLRLGKRLLEKKEKSGKSVDLNLRAVICLKKSHFTCFVRVETANEGRPTWYYHDSMAMESVLTECPFLEDAVEMIAPDFKAKGTGNDYSEGSEMPREAKDWLEILLKTAYICVYEPPYNETYV